MTNEAQTPQNQEDENQEAQQSAEDKAKEELQLLKKRADILGVNYSNNIGVDALKKKIEDKMTETQNASTESKQEEKPEANEPQVNPLELEEGEEPDYSKMSKSEIFNYTRQRTQKEAMKLIRVRVACLDPKKKEIPGEFFTTGNKFIGTVRKFVPFGEATDNGYHIPHCIYEMMKARKFLQISTRRDKATGRMNTTTRYVPEFSIEVLPPLTEAELNRLAVEQQASGRLQNDDLGAL